MPNLAPVAPAVAPEAPAQAAPCQNCAALDLELELLKMHHDDLQGFVTALGDATVKNIQDAEELAKFRKMLPELSHQFAREVSK